MYLCTMVIWSHDSFKRTGFLCRSRARTDWRAARKTDAESAEGSSRVERYVSRRLVGRCSAARLRGQSPVLRGDAEGNRTVQENLWHDLEGVGQPSIKGAETMKTIIVMMLAVGALAAG